MYDVISPIGFVEEYDTDVCNELMASSVGGIHVVPIEFSDTEVYVNFLLSESLL
jgi:hypothetical protein